jgi:uncharacterized protein
MKKNDSPLVEILYFTLFVMAGLFLSQFLAVVALLPFHNYDVSTLMSKINRPLDFPELKMQLLAVQGISTFCSFVLAPSVFIVWREGSLGKFLSSDWRFDPGLSILSFLAVMVSIPFVSLLVQWNESVVLPSALADFELWAKQKEDFLKQMTEMLTKLDNPTELWVGLLVIAFLPALGEELVFRGYLQKKVYQHSQNMHVAVWVSAVVFSAIHFQFYGFVPRMVLGALFGYIYYFGGSFYLPVLAHFTNNGLMLILIYLKQKGSIEFDIESNQEVPIFASLVSMFGTAALLMLFVRHSISKDLA